MSRRAKKGELVGDFAERVFSVVVKIPRGKVASYGQIGRIIGAPRSARYVGYALRANPSPGLEPGDIPCHRVVFKDGSLAKGFAFGGPGEQRRMLEAEGITFSEEGRVRMEEHLWDGNPADDQGLPSGPPADFDWEAELVEHPLHQCEECTRPRADCRRQSSSSKE